MESESIHHRRSNNSSNSNSISSSSNNNTNKRKRPNKSNSTTDRINQNNNTKRRNRKRNRKRKSQSKAQQQQQQQPNVNKDSDRNTMATSFNEDVRPTSNDQNDDSHYDQQTNQCMREIDGIDLSQPTCTSTSPPLKTILWSNNRKNKTKKHSPSPPPIPLSTEQAILPHLLQYGKKENGMFKYQKPHRIQKIKKLCHQYNIRLDQALSLRRHHIQYLNPYCNMAKLGLGSYEDIKASSELFEKALDGFLRNCCFENNDNDNNDEDGCDSGHLEYIDEYEQIRRFRQRCKEMKKVMKEEKKKNENEKKNNSNEESESEGVQQDTKDKETQQQNTIHFKTPPTPDFLLCKPIQIKKLIQTTHNNNHNHHQKNNQSTKTTITTTLHEVNWIDAKMFYGASTIEPGSKTAVGSLLTTAKKYVNHYGKGAFVFFNGYGQELEKVLLEHGVVPLDASPLDLKPVFDHQRTWCANKNGEILP